MATLAFVADGLAREGLLERSAKQGVDRLEADAGAVATLVDPAAE
ncbi:MAG: hypothetical protein Q8R98_20640 [Rubrivivax sp.]|nr:hypothetical protein [Rubrivivax sp.]MDP3614256.1 hypothetical protein [Rubrivivax sp.]